MQYIFLILIYKYESSFKQIYQIKIVDLKKLNLLL